MSSYIKIYIPQNHEFLYYVSPSMRTIQTKNFAFLYFPFRYHQVSCPDITELQNAAQRACYRADSIAFRLLSEPSTSVS